MQWEIQQPESEKIELLAGCGSVLPSLSENSQLLLLSMCCRSNAHPSSQPHRVLSSFCSSTSDWLRACRALHSRNWSRPAPWIKILSYSKSHWPTYLLSSYPLIKSFFWVFKIILTVTGFIGPNSFVQAMQFSTSIIRDITVIVT